MNNLLLYILYYMIKLCTSVIAKLNIDVIKNIKVLFFKYKNKLN